MQTLNRQDIGVFALEFLENLTNVGADEFYAAIMIVADLDDDGDLRVATYTSSDIGDTNIRILHAAELQEIKLMLRAAKAGE